MGFLDNLSKGFSDFTNSTIQKGKDVANVAKYSRMISDEEKSMTRVFEQIGKEYFAAHSEDFEEEFAELIGSIKEAQARIEEYKEAIKELQGITKCEQCGADVPSGSAFCPECGARVRVEKEPEDISEEAPRRLFCMECGAMIIPGSKFCTTCGHKVEDPLTQEELPPEEPEKEDEEDHDEDAQA